MNAFWWVAFEIWTFEKLAYKTLSQCDGNADTDADKRGDCKSTGELKIKNTSKVRQTRLSNLYQPISRHKTKHTGFSHIFNCTKYYFFNDNRDKVFQFCIFTKNVRIYMYLLTKISTMENWPKSEVSRPWNIGHEAMALIFLLVSSSYEISTCYHS